MKNTFLALGLIVAAVVAKDLVAAQPMRPNILYLYVDDMGWGSIGPNGQAQRKAKNLPYVQTPNLDQLAKQGVNFTRGYGCHVCSPARSSQQSGFHQGHTFADRNDPDNAKKAMRADDILMGDALSAAGYVTGYWGKWGYGGSKDQQNPILENIQTLPTSHGYQHVLAELHHVRAHTFFQPTLWSAPAAANAVGGLELVPNTMSKYQNNKSYPSSPALQNHPKYPKTGYCDDAYAFAALDFVRTQGQNYNKTGQPFFGLLAVQIPHAPFDEIATLPDWNKAYAKDSHFGSLSNQAKQWSAMVTRIDEHFGNIFAALDDPNNDGDTSDSIADNTLVVFQSDNGGPGGGSNNELDSNGGLSGVKGKIQEGGIRVPLVMRWPGKISTKSELKAGSQCDMVVDVTDLLPTFCELAQVPTPLGIDGVSIAPTLSGQGQQRKREFIIHEAGNGQSIIRDNYKLVRSKNSPLQLFDLTADHAEQNNIAKKHPKLVKELETLLLGERVAEPKGFANTYHHWTGKSGAKTSVAKNWSDYIYANAGITYTEDKGPPQLSWIARIENNSKKPNVAQADQDLEVLGLQIQGKSDQSLVLGPGIKVTGRNEIRIGDNGTLSINGGQVSTLRWIDISGSGKLEGDGKIQGTVYNNGKLAVNSLLHIYGSYQQKPAGTLSLNLNEVVNSSLLISGPAQLNGQLEIQLAPGFEPVSGETYLLLTAENVQGKFTNSNNEAQTKEGIKFSINYTNSSVSLTAL